MWRRCWTVCAWPVDARYNWVDQFRSVQFSSCSVHDALAGIVAVISQRYRTPAFLSDNAQCCSGQPVLFGMPKVQHKVGTLNIGNAIKSYVLGGGPNVLREEALWGVFWPPEKHWGLLCSTLLKELFDNQLSFAIWRVSAKETLVSTRV